MNENAKKTKLGFVRPQYKGRLSSEKLIEKRFYDWLEQDPSNLISKRAEKATAPLTWLVELLLPTTLVQDATQKTLWAAEALTDRDDILRALDVKSLNEVLTSKLDLCDKIAEQTHQWSMATAAAMGAWDLAGPLGVAPSLISLFTLVFRSIKKIGLCYGFDTSTAAEELIVLEIFSLATSLYPHDKMTSLENIENFKNNTHFKREDVLSSITQQAKIISAHLTRRRSFSSIPAIGALVGSSTNAWLLKDIGWAARNIYCKRRIDFLKASQPPASVEKSA